MKIIFFVPSAYCLGGMQVWLGDLVSALQADPAWEVKVAAPAGTHHNLMRYQEAYPHLDLIPLRNPTAAQRANDAASLG